jgi:hypothetical protein
MKNYNSNSKTKGDNKTIVECRIELKKQKLLGLRGKIDIEDVTNEQKYLENQKLSELSI